MCTLTTIRLAPEHSASTAADGAGRAAGGVRIAFNRDESRLRAAGLAPQRRSFGDRAALLPIDPVSEGTWIAVNDGGLVMALLNAYEGQEPSGELADCRPSQRPSRGAIIPSLLHFDRLADAVATARDVRASYPPYRLLLLDVHEYVQLCWDGRRMEDRSHGSLDRPLLLTSSGLGDHVVGPPRLQLFGEFLARPMDGPAMQNAFHRHVWNDRRHISVCMSRPEARTVSHTVIELREGAACLRHFASFPESAEESRHELELRVFKASPPT